MGQTNVPRTVLSIIIFGLMSVSLALVLGSGAGRFSSPDEPGLAWAGAGVFAMAALIGIPVRLLKPEWREHSRGIPLAAWVVIGLMIIAALVVGIALDMSN